MPTYTYEQAESAYLKARSRVARWFTNFQRIYYARVIEMELIMQWARLSPEMKAEMRNNNPAAYAEVEKKMTALMKERNHAD